MRNDTVHPPENQENSSPGGSTLLAYLQLVRLPNVFTAIADVSMGYIFTHVMFEPGEGWILALLATSSVLLYMAGMILNDVFDAAIDAQERPERPIPSGRASLSTARWIGWQFLVLGAMAGWLAGYQAGQLRPGLVATSLAGCVLLYDGLLKGTFVGPVAMGACRMLNVLLGMSLSPEPWQGVHWLVAAAIGVYVVGITWFARGEANQSRRSHLILGTLLMLASVGMLSVLPYQTDRLKPLLQEQPFNWTIMMILLGAFIVRRCLWAVFQPTPRRVQMVVKQSLLSLVILDAAICFATAGPLAAMAILLLLVPMLALGTRLYST
jgi:4-hydroxybenzoate polyprenyltransferase